MKYTKSAITNRRLGLILIITSAVSFGVMPIFAQLAYNAGADPITVLFLRFTIAAVVINLIMVVSRTQYPRGLILTEIQQEIPASSLNKHDAEMIAVKLH